MSVFKSDIVTPTDFSTTDFSAINYILPLNVALTSFMISLGGDGFKISTDRGATWGATFGEGEGGPFCTILRLHTAVGSAPEGRLIALPLTTEGGTSDKIYTSDDSGVTWTEVTLDDTLFMTRGTHIIQTVGADKAILVGGFSSSNATIQRSLDGGDSWSSVTLPAVSRTTQNLIIKNNGSLYAIGEGSTTGIMALVKSVDEGASWTTVDAFLPVVRTDNIRMDYHSGDDIIAIATFHSLASTSFRIRSVDSSDTITTELSSHPDFGAGVNITDMDWVSAISGITGKWAISFRGDDGNGYWYITDNGDITTWTELKMQGLTDTSGGILSNLVRFVDP